MYKNFYRYLLLLVNVVITMRSDFPQSFHINDDPLLVIVLMIKNEEQVIEQTLQPYVDAGIQSFFIFDTGSTDKTVEVVKSYFTEHALHAACVAQEPFIDFATSRNRALQLAQQKFPNAQFFLMPDAEWYMHNAQGLIEFCHKEKNNKEPVYLVRIGDDNFEFYTPRLIRAASNAQFVGAIHEVLNCSTNSKVPSTVFFVLQPSSAGQEKSAQRWLHDVDILMKKYQENPFDSRNLFYLAQTHSCLGKWEQAYKYYWERTRLTGWPEEDYVALYKLAMVAEHLADKNNPASWAEPLHYYLQAYSKRPQRAEPLVKIAQHYLNLDSMHLAFCFARQACMIDYPQDDILFVEKELYDYTRYEILGRCAWYVGQFDIGEEAVRNALKARPYMNHLHKNLAFYVNRRTSLEEKS